MSPVSLRRSRLRTLLLWAAPLTWLGCGGDGGTDIVLPSLSVTTTTDGVELDPDGYSLVIDGSQNQPIGLAATLVIERLADGQHVVELSGLAANCAPQEANPQTVTVRSGTTTSVSFAVRCSATSGSIEVATSTSGTSMDPDGFTLVLDANPWGPIGTAGTASVAGVTPGAHSIGLTGLAANCQVNGENPRSVAVAPGETIQVPFTVTCSDAGPSPGSLTVTTTTSGTDQDPDGYGIALDGGASQPIGVNASITLPNLSSSAHRVELIGVALNCRVSGANPRNVTISAGQTATVTFAVTCLAPTPGSGSLEVTTTTTGSDLDDGYTLTIDGGAAQPIGANATVSLANVAAAEHQVRLQGIADNCTLQGSNPVRVTVSSGAVSRASFAITCAARPPEPGSLRVSVTTSGASQDNAYTVAVDGGAAQTFTGSRTIQNLAAGPHSVLLGDIAANCTVNGANPQSVTIVGGQTATLTFQVSCVSTGPAVNLRIQRISLTQSTQDAEGNVPLVQSRDGFLRVFVTATGDNDVAASVRVRFSRNGAVVQTVTIPAPSATTPSAIQEGSLQSSWNVRIPGSLIQPNTSVLADVDPDNTVAETNESDNSFPASGNGQDLSVQSVPTAIIRLVPIRQLADNSIGSVANPSQLVDLTRRMHPLGNVRIETGNILTIDGPVGAADTAQWNQILSDLEGRRIAEGATDRTYYGLLRLNYTSGIVGNGFVGAPSAVGWDDPGDAGRVMAHELGHTWGQLHTPCGGPGGVDPNFPYRGGNIGVYGYDLGRDALEAPTVPDIMGYCDQPWISDYIYKAVMNYRRSHPLTAAEAELAQPCVLVWGRVVNGQAILEPSFQIVTRPKLPKGNGPYTIDARSADGSSLFTLSFDGVSTGDDMQGGKYFAFAVPIDQARAARLGSLHLTGPGIRLAAVNQARQQLRRGAAPDNITVQSEPGAVALRWNAALHPMLMVRDPDTGEVLAFARGGNARVWTGKKAVDVEVSNGVQSQRLRLAINR